MNRNSAVLFLRYMRTLIRATAIERELIKEFRWFTRAELADWHEPVFPVNLLELLDAEAEA